MPIDVSCPGCRRTMSLPDHFVGRAGRCKRCGAAFRVPTFVPAAPGKGPLRAIVVRLKGRRPVRRTLAALGVVYLLAIVVASAVRGEPWAPLFGLLGLLFLVMIFGPMVAPPVLARRGALSPGRWLIMSGFFAVSGAITLVIASGMEGDLRMGIGNLWPTVTMVMLGFGMILGVPSCLLAAALHKPRD